MDRLFEQYDKDKSGTLDFGELHELLVQIDNKLTSLPATAQRAHQQGQYLGRKLNKMAKAAPGLAANQVIDGDVDDAVYKAFEYHHLGSLAYVGNAAVFDNVGKLNYKGGLLAVFIWRGVYFAQSVSLRTRILLAMDWSKRTLFGRGEFDVSSSFSLRLIARETDFWQIWWTTRSGQRKRKINGWELGRFEAASTGGPVTVGDRKNA